MNKKKYLLLLLLLSLLLLASCKNDAEAPSEEISKDEESASCMNVESKEEMTYEASREETEVLEKTWVYLNEEDNIRLYLILSPSGEAQAVKQDMVGNLIDLSHGSWILSGKDIISFELDKDMENGEPLDTPKKIKSQHKIKIDNNLSLTMQNMKELAGVSEEAVFYMENRDPETGELICRAVSNYYKETYKEEYPGKIEIEEVTEEGFYIHLYEDMGDHTATAGRFLVDPVTFMGIDEIMGTEIDFASYLN